jgi:hypothetical protein
MLSDFSKGLKPKAQYWGYSRNPGLTETLLRPLARRREITARPCFVFIRTRKPWVFERRRRLGWNVRLGKVVRSCLGCVNCRPSRPERNTLKFR